MNTLLHRIPLWLGFVIGLVGSVGGASLFDGWQSNSATYGGMALSLATGAAIARQPRIAAFLGATPTLWFLFVFNAAVAVVLLSVVGDSTGYLGGGFMTAVSLGAAMGLISRYRSRRARMAAPEGVAA